MASNTSFDDKILETEKQQKRNEIETISSKMSQYFISDNIFKIKDY